MRFKPAFKLLVPLLLIIRGLDAQQKSPVAIVPIVRGLDATLGGTTSQMGAGAGLQFVSKYVNLNGSYSLLSLYMDGTESDAKDADLPKPTNEISGASILEGGIQLNPISWETELAFDIVDRVVEGVFGTTITTTTYYHIENYPSRVFIGLRGGYYRWQSPLSSTMKDINDPLIAANGAVLNGTSPITKYNYTYTNMKSTSLYAGVAYSYFVYRWNRYQTWFFDYFLSPKTDIDPVILAGVPFDITGPGSKGFPVRQNGWRFGVDIFVDGVTAHFEGGVRPGSYGGYFFTGLGFALPQWF